MQLTAVFEKVFEGYIAFVAELPGANTQGATLEEAHRLGIERFTPPGGQRLPGKKSSRDLEIDPPN